MNMEVQKSSNKSASMSSILETTDEFSSIVPWSEHRCVLVYRRRHGGRTYIRLRTWNKHRTKHVWYPTKRSFVIPLENTEALADALYAAFREECSPKPDWLIGREESETHKLEWVEKMQAPSEVIEHTQEVLRRSQRKRA